MNPSIRTILGLGLALTPVLALAQPAAAPAPTADPPNVVALKGQIMDDLQSIINWRTNYWALGEQVGKLQATIAADEAKIKELQAAAPASAPIAPAAAKP